jgi:DNA-binding response OmpR family regulator
VSSHIVVIEDDPAVRGMLELTFAVEGYETEMIVDGRAGLARLDGTVPDLVILDVMMPHADGYQVLQELRAREGWTDTPVIVCTALSDDEDVWRGWSSGADYLLIKPFDLDHLRDVVARLLMGERITPS